MKISISPASTRSRRFPGASPAFTLTELIVASAISLLVMSGVIVFMDLAGKSLSSATAQTFLNQEAGSAMGFILGRVRVATSITNDASGNTLTLGFDDDFTVDKDHDGKAYNDQDHFEQFQFRNGDGKDDTTADNSLVYIPRVGTAQTRILVPSGIRKLPNRQVFTITNRTTVLINLGLADGYSRDWNQSVDLQLAAVPRNRPTITNVVSILP